MVKEILYQKLNDAEVIEGSIVQELMEDEEPFFSLHTAYKVELFSGKFYTIYFTNLTDSELPDALEWLKEGASILNIISLDLEWKSFKPTKPIALFQMATKDRCLVIKNDADPNETNRNAFTQFMTTNKFIGKGISCDLTKLYHFFNVNFESRIIDIHTYLQRTKKSLNFIKMYQKLVKAPPTASFKDKKVTISNWESDVYTNKQFFYSSFDAIALYESFITAYPTNPSLFITCAQIKRAKIEKRRLKREKRKLERLTEENKKQDNKTHERNTFKRKNEASDTKSSTAVEDNKTHQRNSFKRKNKASDTKSYTAVEDNQGNQRNPFKRKNEASDTKSYTTNEYSSTVSTDNNESIIECLSNIEATVFKLNSLIESLINA